MKFLFRIIIISLLIFPAGLVFPAENGNKTLFEQGMEAFKSGNYGSSELLLRKIIDSGSSEYKDRAWYYFALSIFYQKKYESAVFEFNRFLSSCSDLDLCSLSRYWIAESYFQQNDNIRAIQEFNRFISQNKNDEYRVQAYDRIGRIYFMQKRYDEAIIEWKKALEKCKDEIKNNQKRLNIGEAYFLNENYDEAIEFLKPLLNAAIDPKTISIAKMITGKAYQIKGKNTIALKIFSGMDEMLLTEKPFNEVQYYRALAYIALGNNNFAALHLKTFLSTGKESKWIYHAKYELAKIYIKENNLKEAKELLEDIRKSNSETLLKGRASLELSRIYYDDNIEEAVKCLNEASVLDSPEEKKEALSLLSKAMIKQKKFSEAESILEKLINDYSFDKNMDMFRFLLATVYLEQGDFKKAIKGFGDIKDINPFSKYINESLYYMGLAYLKNNQIDEAIIQLNKYINLQKTEKKYDAVIQLLDLYAQKRDFKNAEKIFTVIYNNYLKEKGVEEALYKYGIALIDNRKSAKNVFNTILQRFGKSEAAGRLLLKSGDDAFAKKDYAEAEKLYRQYLSIHWRQEAASVFLYRIISLERMGRHKEIISIIEAKDAMPPMDDFTSKQVALWLSRSYYKASEYKKAYDMYSGWRLVDLSEEDLLYISKSSAMVDDIPTAVKAAELIQRNKNIRAEAFYELSLYYVSNNNYENANEYLSRIFTECPSSDFIDKAKTETADIYIKEGKYEEAIQTLKDIKNEKVHLRKNSLLIISYFRINNGIEAALLTKNIIKELIGSPYEEIVIKENLIYHYKNKNINEFNKYTQYLKKYPGNNLFVNYLYGKLNFESYNYKTSYYYFYKLANSESEYQDEAIYYLGLISLLNNKDSALALKYFQKLSENSNPDNKFASLGKINLSILSNETGNKELSKKLLYDINDNINNRLLKIQAENLIEYFGYKSELP